MLWIWCKRRSISLILFYFCTSINWNCKLSWLCLVKTHKHRNVVPSKQICGSVKLYLSQDNISHFFRVIVFVYVTFVQRKFYLTQRRMWNLALQYNERTLFSCGYRDNLTSVINCHINLNPSLLQLLAGVTTHVNNRFIKWVYKEYWIFYLDLDYFLRGLPSNIFNPVMRCIDCTVIKQQPTSRTAFRRTIHYNGAYKLFNSMHTNYFNVASLITSGLLKPTLGSRAN